MINDRIKTFLCRCPRVSVAWMGWVWAAVTLFAASAVHADDWPQWLGPRRDGVWRESGILKRFPTNGPSIRWRVPIGAGYSGPSVAGGRVYVTDRQLAPKTSNPGDPFKRGIIA